MRKTLTYVLLVLGALSLAPAIAATDQDIAREAVRRGQAQPLSKIMPGLTRRCGAKLLDAKLNRDRGKYVYELTVLKRGVKAVLLVDAKSGRLIRGQCP